MVKTSKNHQLVGDLEKIEKRRITVRDWCDYGRVKTLTDMEEALKTASQCQGGIPRRNDTKQ